MASRVFISCGESSGDRYGAQLIHEANQRTHDIEWHANGGDHLANAGAQLLAHVVKKSTIGFIEPLKWIPYFVWLLHRTKRFIKNHNIHVVVIIDHQGFNIPLAKWCHSQGIPVVSFIAPQYWMWGKTTRAQSFIDSVSTICCIFKKEYDFYHAFAPKKAVFVGHPLTHMVPQRRPSDTPMLGLFPGSRSQEISRSLPVMLSVAHQLFQDIPDLSVELSVSSDGLMPMIAQHLRHCPFSVTITHDSYDCMARATASLVTSGTVSLEHALVGTPCVVMYKLSALSYWLMRQILWDDFQKNCHGFMALPNILAKKEACPEFLQKAATPAAILSALAPLMTKKNAQQTMLAQYDAIRRTLTVSNSPIRLVNDQIISCLGLPQSHDAENAY